MKLRLLIGCVTAVLLVLKITYWFYFASDIHSSTRIFKYHADIKTPVNVCANLSKTFAPAFWKQVDYEQLPIPKEAIHDAVSINVEAHSIKVNDVIIYYKESKALKPISNALSVLFLHGAAFTSDTWESLGTLNLVSAFGFRAVAVDLPGFGKSPRAAIPQKAEFLSYVIAALKLQKLVIVSPSMSGIFSIPYVIEHWKNISGYIPISPVIPTTLPINICEKFPKDVIMDKTCKDLMKYEKNNNGENFSCLKVPVMVIHGQYDRSENSAQMCRFPWSKGVKIPHGQHAAYMTKPSLWHKLLYNFLSIVNKTETCRW